MDSDPVDDKYKSARDTYADVEVGGGIPVGPNGTPVFIGEPPPIPAASPQTFVCLRGPCRHYWEMAVYLDAGNPEETWNPEDGLKDEHGQPLKRPAQIRRTCLAHPGTETELTDELIERCNRWDPLTPRETSKLEKRRSKYLKLFPITKE